MGGVALGVSTTALLTLYVIGLFPLEEAPQSTFGEGGIRGLNRSLGRNPLWDWTLLVLSSSYGVYGCILIIGYVLALLAWRRRFEDYGRLFGYGALAGVLAFVAQEVGDEISDIFPTPEAPLLRLDDLIDLRRFYGLGWHDLQDRTHTPEENILGWGFLILFLLPRAGVAAAAAFILLILHGMAKAVIGMDWLLSMGVSALIGAAMGGAALVVLPGVIAWTERKAEEIFVLRFWHMFSRAARRPGARPELRSPARESPLSRVKNLRTLRRNLLWVELIEREVLPLFPGAPADIRLETSPPGDADTWSPYVRFLTLPGEETYVVKAAWRFGGPLRRAGRLDRYLLAARHQRALEELQFPVPRLYWVREGLAWVGLLRYVVLVEEYIQGRPLDATADDETAEAMDLLARLHAQTAERWGPLSGRRGFSAEHYLLAELRREVLYDLRRIGRLSDRPWPEAAYDRLWRAFERRGRALLETGTPPFRLVHGDVTARNFIRSARRLRMIDFADVAFHWAGAEIIKAAMTLSGRDPARCGAAWRRYFETAGPDRWREFQAEASLGLARAALRELAHGRALGFRSGAAPPSSETVGRWMEALLTLPDAVFGERPELTSWEKLLPLVYDPSG